MAGTPPDHDQTARHLQDYMKWAIGILVAAGMIATIIWAYGAFGTSKVVVAAPERREAVRAVYATGTVRAERIAHLRPEVGGAVTAVTVQQGGEIREGEKVMEIAVQEEEDAVNEQQARVREASVAVQTARDNYDQELALLEQGATTQQAVDNMKATLDRATAALKTVQASLAVRKTRSGKGIMESPITGVVTQVNVTVGDVIPPNMEAVTILDPSSFKVYADIDELDINRIRPGQEAIIAFDAMPSQRFRARVERIIPQADEITKTLPVILNLVDVVPNLSDGLTATINIVQERRSSAMTIPAAAVLEMNDTAAVVFVVDDYEKLDRRVVRPGIRGEDYIEVVDGLRGDERVALNPQREWKSGEVVEIDRERMKETLQP
jgi:RND family efflux transporter MFP subunit